MKQVWPRFRLLRHKVRASFAGRALGVIVLALTPV
jgi:hypothetical protein